MVKQFWYFMFFAMILGCKSGESEIRTIITNWPDNKKGAISITYDDATINQFRKALPIMDSLKIKGTFFINTADIPDSKFPPKFIGRPLREIIEETKTIATDKNNLLERASALRFLDLPDAVALHNQCGSLFEQGKDAQAMEVVDNAFEEIREKKSFKEVRPVLLDGELITWNEIKQFAANGHEFGNHTISHPRLAVLDEANLLYELEKCKEEIFYQLGHEHIFSAECPFGTENERVMSYAYKVHPALRNRMPETFLEELNRGSKKSPMKSDKPYIQWQRGPLQKNPLSEMKSWVDTTMMRDNIWLVLTFHGVDGIGWEAKPSTELREYFSYMKQSEKDLWIDTFGNATKYIREKMNSTVAERIEENRIVVSVTNSLDSTIYNYPLTLKTYLRTQAKKVEAKQAGTAIKATIIRDEKGVFVLYSVKPNGGDIEISY